MNNKEQKKEILDNIFLKEEDTLKELEILVEYSKIHFKIEYDTCNIIFNTENEYSNKEKIIFYLISRYFCKEYELIEDYKMSISEISEVLGIPNTTLSAPLGMLLKDGIVKKESSKYYIVHHRIKSFLIDKQLK